VKTIDILAVPQGALQEELVENLLERPFLKVERIVSEGHRSPQGFWYDQPWDEWVLLLSGSAGLAFEGEDTETLLRPGIAVHIPARRRHRVSWTAEGAKTYWLALHFPPSAEATQNKFSMEGLVAER
jgi:cupin 2 domain-containing protein